MTSDLSLNDDGNLVIKIDHGPLKGITTVVNNMIVGEEHADGSADLNIDFQADRELTEEEESLLKVHLQEVFDMIIQQTMAKLEKKNADNTSSSD